MPTLLRRLLIALAALLAGSLVQAAPTVGEWVTFGNGPEHNGYYPKTIGTSPFTAGWKRSYTIQLNQVVVSGDAVYGTLNSYFGSGQKAFAVNVSDGADRWSYPLASAYSVNPPSYANGRLYFQRGDHSSDTHLWCLDASNGALVWAAPHAAQWESYMAPTIADGSVYVDGGSYGGLYGFDATTGAQKFFVSRPQEDGWTPSYANGVVYSCVNGNFLATDGTSGAQLWTRTLSGTSSWYEGNVPVIYNGKIIIRGPGRLLVLDIASRTQDWAIDSTSITGTPAVADGIVYVCAGATVKAYDLSTGSALGTYTASGTLTGQPLITKDLVLVSNATNTFVFNRSTFAQQQNLPAGGALSYASGRLYIADRTGVYNSSTSTTTYSLSTFTVAASEADPAAAPLTPPPPPSPKPNPDRTLSTTSATWIECARKADIAYFLFDAPAKIERYDLVAGAWLKPISLPDGPKAFTVAANAIYVSFGTGISAFALDGSTETVLGNNAFAVKTIMELNGRLYLADQYGSKFAVMNPVTGAINGSTNFSYSQTGYSLAATKNKFFSVTTGVSPSDILQTVINADGTLGSQTDSPYHGAYPTGSRAFVFGSEGRVATDAGIIYSTGDLSYLGSLAGAFTDGDFSLSSPVILRNNTLVGYSNTFLETGRKALTGTPTRLFVANNIVSSFEFVAGRGVAETKTPLTDLVPPTTGPGIDPSNLAYTPDAVEFGNGGVVYLLSKLHLSVFRWSVPERRYLPTIALAEAPRYMTYSATNNRLYLSYSTGRIAKIDVDTSLTEVNFANSPLPPDGLAVAGDFLFADDGSGAWATHYVYSSTGALLSSKDWNYYSRQYIWNATNRKMYFFRDSQSPNDVYWEDIDLEGKLGAELDSPYHGDYVIQPPIRVSPDGKTVLLGNGDLYAGITLVRNASLSMTIADAVWLNGVMTTARAVANGTGATTTVETWNDKQQVTATTSISGTPVRMFALADGYIVISQASGRLYFTKLTAALQPVSTDPTYTLSLPTALTLAATNLTSTTATLNGTANTRGLTGSAYFEYGPTTAYGSQTASTTLTNGTADQAVNRAITGLTALTTYQYRIVVTNADGVTVGANQSFQTTPPKPTVSSSSVSNVTATSARVNATVSPQGAATTVYAEYGLTTSFGLTTPSADLGVLTGSKVAAVDVTGLQSGKTYYGRLVAVNAGGTTYGSTLTWSTPQVPAVTTLGATGISVSGAVLNGTANPRGVTSTAFFEYGPTPLFGSATAPAPIGNGTADLAVAQYVAALTPDTDYYYRLVVTNAGGSFYGPAATFRTGAGSATGPLVSAVVISNITTNGAQVEGTVTPRGSATTAYIEYGTTNGFGLVTDTFDVGTGDVPVPVTRMLSGLHPGQTYQCRIVAVNAGGTAFGGAATFKTSGDIAASATTGEATEVDASSAVLHGSVTAGGAETYVHFEFGKHTAQENVSAEFYLGAGLEAEAVQMRVSGLAAATTYDYQIVAVSPAGTLRGEVREFTTGRGKPKANDDRAYATRGSQVKIDVLANDTGAPPSALTVTAGTALSGTVTVNADKTITFQPAASFAHEDHFSYTIADQDGNTSSATVWVRDSFVGSSGVYQALIGDINSSFERAGSLTVSLSAQGGVTGALWIGATKFPLKGELSPDAAATFSFKTKDSAISLNFSVEAETNSFTGLVTIDRGGDGLSLPFTGQRRATDRERGTMLAGNYTMLLTPAGFATFTVQGGGNAVFAGRSVDGKAFSGAAFIDAESVLRLYTLPGTAKNVSLHGKLTFRPIDDVSDFDGDLASSRAGEPGAELLTALGSRYVGPTAGSLALQLPKTHENVVLKFGRGSALITQETNGTLLPDRLAVKAGAVTGTRLNVKKGLFSGSLTVAGERTRFYGALLQRQSIGGGVVTHKSQPGWVSLEPSPSVRVSQGAP